MSKRDGLASNNFFKKVKPKEKWNAYTNAQYSRKEIIRELPLSAQPNVLHRYASYNTLFTLSVLTPDELKNPQIFFNTRPHDIIVQSGGIKADANFKSPQERRERFEDKKILENARVARALTEATTEFNKNNDIYFRSVDMTSIPGYNEKRRLTSVTNINIELVEPAGITLLEKIKGAAANNGYIDHLNAAYLLTIEFKGFDENGSPMDIDMKTQKRVIPIKLMTCEIDVNQAGSSYVITAVPYNEFPMTNTFTYPRTSGTISTTALTTADVVNEITKLLNDNEDQEVEQELKQYPDRYSITIDEDLSPEKQISYELLSQAGMVQKNNITDTGSESFTMEVIKIDPSVNILKTLEEVMKSHPDYNTVSFDKWYDKVTRINSGQLDPNDGLDSFYKYFRIRTNIILQTDKFDYKRQVHPRDVNIVVEPYYINGYNLGRPGHRQGNNLVTYVAKDYNYIFTGDNIDIQDLKINYRVAYFQSTLKDVDANASRRFSPEGNRDEISQTVDADQAKNYVTADDILLLQSDVSNGKSANANRTKGGDVKADAFFDAITNPTADMVIVDMEILGDPAWLGQSQFIGPAPKIKSPGISTNSDNNRYFRGGNKDFIWNPELKCYNVEIGEPMINLTFKTPSDLNDKTGVYEIPNTRKGTFSGLYKVIRVQNKFVDGRFTQVLTMTRFNNQDSDAEPITNSKISKKDGVIIKGTQTNSEANTVRRFTNDISNIQGSS